MPFGAQVQPDGNVRFQLWAPEHQRIELEIVGAEPSTPTLLPMQPQRDGWHQLLTPRAPAGTLYKYRLPDGLSVPDPASRFQPSGVHGPSEVIDPAAYRWSDDRWRGRPWHDAVIYELHVGCFTTEGSFRGALERLDHLVRLGVTAIEVMPVAAFPGQRNWGYDGVLPFAPAASYGRPEDFKALVDAAHARGLMLILDVVYNHFGPEGNYLSTYAPSFFNDRHQTPWGAAVNFDAEDSRAVREFVVHNALYWIEEFHIDGLRLDAVHAIHDDSPRHLLTELAQRLRAVDPARHVHLVLENEHNHPSYLAPSLYNAQWNDDVHHVLHVASTGEREGYYADYADDIDRLGRALAEGFAFQGEVMPYRGSARGEPCAHLPPQRFVAFLQNHDQIGNRALGERLSAIAPAAAVRAVTAVTLLLPQIPMLFMGEEWHSARPFQFFCDFGGELADAVRQGRRQEFSRFAAFQSESARDRIPDPLAESTFQASKLDWDALHEPSHAAIYHWYRQLLKTRADHIVPLLPDLVRGGHYRAVGKGALIVNWIASTGTQLTLWANLSAQEVAGFPESAGRLLWQEGVMGDKGSLAAWGVRWILRP